MCMTLIMHLLLLIQLLEARAELKNKQTKNKQTKKSRRLVRGVTVPLAVK